MMLVSLLGLAGALPGLLNPTSVGLGLCLFFVVLFVCIALRPFKDQIWGWCLKALKKDRKLGHKVEVDCRSLGVVVARREAAELEIVRRVTDQCKESRGKLGVGNLENCSMDHPCKFCLSLIEQANHKPKPKVEGMAKL